MSRPLLAPILGLSALAIALAPLPAAARESGVGKMAEKMRDPDTQRAMTAAVQAMSEAMLNIPLEPFARAAEAMGDRKAARRMRGSTLRDYAGPGAEDTAREMSRKLPAIMGAMGGMAEAAEEMAPVLEGMTRDMAARMGDAIKDSARRGADGARDDSPPSARAEREDDPPPSAVEE
jgi:hypothetical protein